MKFRADQITWLPVLQNEKATAKHFDDAMQHGKVTRVSLPVRDASGRNVAMIEYAVDSPPRMRNLLERHEVKFQRANGVELMTMGFQAKDMGHALAQARELLDYLCWGLEVKVRSLPVSHVRDADALEGPKTVIIGPVPIDILARDEHEAITRVRDFCVALRDSLR